MHHLNVLKYSYTLCIRTCAYQGLCVYECMCYSRTSLCYTWKRIAVWERGCGRLRWIVNLALIGGSVWHLAAQQETLVYPLKPFHFPNLLLHTKHQLNKNSLPQTPCLPSKELSPKETRHAHPDYLFYSNILSSLKEFYYFLNAFFFFYPKHIGSP